MGNQLSKKARKRLLKKSRTGQDTSSSGSSSDMMPMNYDDVLLEAAQYQEQHYLIKHLFQSNTKAPIDGLLSVPGSQCLDIGCGITATWIQDMAAEYPNALFTGVDLLTVANQQHIPRNCEFKTLDILCPLLPTLVPESFDFIYQRFMFNTYEMNDARKKKFREFVQLLKPGGYIELVEPDFIPRQAGPKYTSLCYALINLVGTEKKEIYHGPVVHQCLVEMADQLQDIRTDYTSMPVCWGGYIGKMLYQFFNALLKQLSQGLWLWLPLEGDYDEKVFNNYLDSAFNECVEYKTYINLHWVYAKKCGAPTYST
ncbi:hypothetical protein BC940DRAFT_290352 [Gongronella butleri]|nr:hypothetical protein BC940DRAFT_290352 [Gongronella butleri]